MVTVPAVELTTALSMMGASCALLWGRRIAQLTANKVMRTTNAVSLRMIVLSAAAVLLVGQRPANLQAPGEGSSRTTRKSAETGHNVESSTSRQATTGPSHPAVGGGIGSGLSA